MINLPKFFIATILLTCGSLIASATHLKGGYIQVKKLHGLTYEITFIGYQAPGSAVPIGGGELHFGDGNSVSGSDLETALIKSTPAYNIVEIKATHQYAGHETYTVSYEEEFRTAEILNMENSISTLFYVETTFETLYLNTTPTIPLEHLMAAFPSGQFGVRSLYQQDTDGDILRFAITAPHGNNGEPIVSYISPDQPSFYAEHESGNSAGNGKPIFKIDRLTGTLAWDAPGDQFSDNHHCSEAEHCGEYTIAIEVAEYREVQGREVKISSTLADIGILAVDQMESDLSFSFPSMAFCSTSSSTFTFSVDSNLPYHLQLSKRNGIANINEAPVENVLTSTFSTDSIFTVTFEPISEERSYTFTVISEDQSDSSSFTYLVSDQCDRLLLSTPKNNLYVEFFPNPASDQVHIKGVKGKLDYIIISLDGQLVKKGFVTASADHRISLIGLTNGIYLLKLQDTRTRQSVTKKLIVKRP